MNTNFEEKNLDGYYTDIDDFTVYYLSGRYQAIKNVLSLQVVSVSLA